MCTRTNARAHVTTMCFFQCLCCSYAGLLAALAVASMARALLMQVGFLHASQKLHNTMFAAVIASPIRFFDTNPVGRILNRFSKVRHNTTVLSFVLVCPVCACVCVCVCVSCVCACVCVYVCVCACVSLHVISRVKDSSIPPHSSPFPRLVCSLAGHGLHGRPAAPDVSRLYPTCWLHPRHHHSRWAIASDAHREKGGGDSLTPSLTHTLSHSLTLSRLRVPARRACAASVINPWVLLAAGPIIVVFFFLRNYFLRTAREIKRVEAISRSPIYSHFRCVLLQSLLLFVCCCAWVCKHVDVCLV